MALPHKSYERLELEAYRVSDRLHRVALGSSLPCELL